MILEQRRRFSGFSNVLSSEAGFVRPEKLSEIRKAVQTCAAKGRPVTMRGAGRSYGDAGFSANGGLVVDCSRLNRIHAADFDTGELIVEPGVSFRDLYAVAGKRGWAPPVSPGLSAITVGGAFSMDIHGKNHRVAGGFSRAVKWIDLRIANGDLLRCSRTENKDIFFASIGGLGTTGAVERICLQLEPTKSNLVSRTIPTDNLAEALSRLLEHKHEDYVVYWGDLLNARSAEHVKGSVIVTNSGDTGVELSPQNWRDESSLPLSLARPFFNTFSNRIFNAAYGWRLSSNTKPFSVTTRSHLFTWDKLASWNSLYGSRGFFEYQFVIPESKLETINVILSLMLEGGVRPYLFAMKLFGPGEGLLSYAKEDGVSVLVDMPATEKARQTLDKADQVVSEASGRVHLAKDSRISQDAFEDMYRDVLPRFRNALARVDPNSIFQTAQTVRLGIHKLRDE